MDKTVEIVLVVMVALVTASVLLFMMTQRAGGFGEFAQGETTSSKCKLWEVQGAEDKARDAGCNWPESANTDVNQQELEDEECNGLAC